MAHEFAAGEARIQTIGRGMLAEVGLFEHGEDWYGDPHEEVFAESVVIFTRTGTWEIHRERQRGRVDPSLVVLGHEGESYRCVHRERHPSDQTLYLVFDASAVAKALDEHSSREARSMRNAGPPETHIARRNAALDNIAVALSHLSPDMGLTTDALALQLLAELHRLPSADDDQQRLSTRAVARARDHLEANYARNVPLDDLAAAVHVSPFHLHRLFKAATGQTPHHYLLEIRLRRARHALTATDQSIEAIGAAVGYPNPSHFSSVFQRNVGVSPSEYRRRVRADR